MAWINSEEEVDKIIEELKSKNKKYITKGVSFDKNNEAHMRLLKYCLMYSDSFSAIVKELIASRVNSLTDYEKVDIAPTISHRVTPQATIESESTVLDSIEESKNDYKDIKENKINISNFL